MITGTWWTNSAIYIPEYSQYWFQHAALNLITKSSEFTLLQYSTTLSSIITSFCIIFDICHIMNQQYYIYFNIFPGLILSCRVEFNHYKREFTVLLYSTALSSIIISLCVIFDICYMMNLPFIYIPEYSQYWFQHAALNLITKSSEFTLLQHSTTLSSIIASFCITFDNCYMMNQQYIYILVYSQHWYQHAVMNLVTTRREFTLSQYSTTLSSIIASFCITFDNCYMMNR